MTVEYFGVGSLASLSSILLDNSIKNIFLVTGKSSYALSGGEKILSHLLKGKNVVRFSDFSTNIVLEDVIKGLSLFHQETFELVIGVGGGSVLDMAKIISVLGCNHGNPKDIITGRIQLQNKGIPLVAVPTTAGSGAEATQFCVIYIDNKKYSFEHQYILPTYVIIDPKLTYSLPPYETAVSGFDALSQAIESYWANNATNESRIYAKKAINDVFPLIEKVVNKPDNKSRATLLRGANYAGKAINISKTTAPHAISYPLTTYFKIPHGHAVALTLGKFFLIHTGNFPSTTNYLSCTRQLVNIMKELFAIMDCNSAIDCHNKWYSLMNSTGLETNPSNLGILPSNIDLILENINMQRLLNNPVPISEAIVRSLFNTYT